MIPPTPGWETFETELNGELRKFVTTYYLPDPVTMQPVMYGGYIYAHSFEEAQYIAESVEPKHTVEGVLGGTIDLSRFN